MTPPIDPADIDNDYIPSRKGFAIGPKANGPKPPRAAPVAVTLTRRERDMIQGVVDGKKNKAIAWDCGLSENTVKVYLSRLFCKVGVGDRWELGLWGRALAESMRLADEHYRELQRELHPDAPEAPAQAATFENVTIAKYDVFRAMAQTITLSLQQASEIMNILTTKRIP